MNNKRDGELADHLRLRLQFIDDWKSTVSHHYDAAAKQTDGQIAYGSLALKSAYILNGGGLLALPAFAQIFKVDNSFTADQYTGLYIAGILFILGLIGAAVSTVIANLNYGYGHHRELSTANLRTFELRKLYYPRSDETAVKALEDQMDEARVAIQDANKGLGKTYKPAFIVGFASYITFISGSFAMLRIVSAAG